MSFDRDFDYMYTVTPMNGKTARALVLVAVLKDTSCIMMWHMLPNSLYNVNTLGNRSVVIHNSLNRKQGKCYCIAIQI